SQGHFSREPKQFYKYQEYAMNRSIAIFMTQLWIEGDPPWGYTPYERTQAEILMGVQPGYHLDAYDEHLFVNAIVEAYNISSLYLHGFSMSGANVMMLSAFDRYAKNISDYAVVNGGHMVLDHPFLKQMDDLGLTNFFAGENFFLFNELDPGDDPAEVKNETATDDIIIDHGGNMDIEAWLVVPWHGALLDTYPQLMNASLNNYTYYSNLRLS
ncbi:MAG: hypothetical protein ACTSYB_13870, partial [Candidatus Helarchaeota archaeon]